MANRRQNLSSIGFDPNVNAGLWLDKFYSVNAGDESAAKSEHFKQVTEVKVPEIYSNQNCGFFVRWENELNAFGAKTRVLRLDARMIVGLGGDSVLENSITLHRIYGLPMIPGTAIKGLAAAYASKFLGSNWKRGEFYHRLVFGAQDYAGIVTFFDALLKPNGNRKIPLHNEIMTVHHADYYGDKGAPPADWDDPTPIPFVSASGDYLVPLAAPKGFDFVTDRVFEILALAFERLGVGAKTSSGYGRGTFAPSQEETQQEEEQYELRRFIQRLSALKDPEVPGRIKGFYDQWKNSQASDITRLEMAKAIIEKVKKARRESTFKEKDWYRDLLDFTNPSS
ncbi:MAG: type III-B CRISPR module RAMP protein Cmr6 [Blastocatellia bacterium]